MAIFNIFDYYEKETLKSGSQQDPLTVDPSPFFHDRSESNYIAGETPDRDQIFSAIAARFFFALLLIADIAWAIYSSALLVIKLAVALLLLFKVEAVNRTLSRTWLNFRRSLVCSIALTVAIFTPALGIMFACMYFLMYDKEGVEEVVPLSLREQFKDLFPQ